MMTGGRFRRCLAAKVLGVPLLVGALSIGASAHARQAQEGGSPSDAVSIEARPRWGPGPSGAWTSYLVTLRNDGVTDLEGDVVLVPARLSNPGPFDIKPSALDLVNAPTDLAAPVAVFDTARLPVPSVVPGRSSVPQAWPSYRIHVVVAGGTEKVFTPVVLEAPYGYRAELRQPSGKLIASSPVAGSAVARSAWALAVLSSSESEKALDSVAAAYRRVSELSVTRFASPGDFPDDLMTMSGLQAVIIDDFDTAQLTRRQVDALRHFVGLGGSLVLGGGVAWRHTLGSLPDELVPLRPAATASVSLGPLSTADDVVTASATVATGSSAHARVVAESGGQPLVLERGYGAGRVVQLSYDPLAEPFASDTVLSRVGLATGLLPALDRLTISPTYEPEPPESLWEPALDRSPPKPVARWSLIVAGAWAVLLGPALFALGRRRTRRDVAWVAVPTAVVLACILAFATSTEGDGANVVDNVVQVRTLGPGGIALDRAFHGLVTYAARSNGVTLPVPTGGAAANVLAEPARVRAAGIDSAYSTAFAQPFAAVSRRLFASSAASSTGQLGEVLAGEDGAAVLRTGQIRRGQAWTIQSITVTQGPGAIVATLGLAAADHQNGRLRGTVTNDTGRRLHSMSVKLPGKSLVPVAAVLEANSTVSFDVDLARPPQIAGLAAREARVMAAATRYAGPRTGQAVLVALGEPPSKALVGQAGTALQVVQQTVDLADVGD